jgi:hypothetical protein
MPDRFVINEDGFRRLVGGEEVELEGSGIKLVLDELGIDEMFMCLRFAMTKALTNGKLPGLPRECEFCGNNMVPILMRLGAHPAAMRAEVGARDPMTHREEYVACPNCLIGLVMTSLTPQQFLRAREQGGDITRWYLHDDFYDPDSGEALQPKMPGLAERR